MFKWRDQLRLGKLRLEQLQLGQLRFGKLRLGQLREKKKQENKQLWGRDFNVVRNGLDEEQVVSFVDELVKQRKASSSASFRSFLKTAVTDAGQVADSIRMRAQAEAEEEAAGIIAQANQEAEEIKSRAEEATEKEVEDILSAAKGKVEITGVEAKQKTLLFLLKMREEMEAEIKGEYKKAYSQLFNSLQNLMREGQDVEAELKGKRVSLWESGGFQLREQEAALLSTSGEAAPPFETPAPTETEAKPDIVTEEKVEEPVQLREEVTEEKVEEPVQLREEVTEEKVEEPVQLQEEVTEEKVEEPVQLREEVTISEPVGATVEGLLEQRLPEERPEREETEPGLLEQDSQDLYTGEVELAIDVPVDLKMVSKLYNSLQTIPEVRILRTRGSANRGSTITVALGKPIPLISVISSKLPGVAITPEPPEKDSFVKGKPSSLLGKGKKGVRRIKLALKEA